jgi:hypothetical protein
VRVSAVLPASIDTPLFPHAGNWFGRRAKPLDSVTDPDRAARAIVACAQRPVRERLVGRGARAMIVMHAVGGPLFERLFAAQVERNHVIDEPSPPSPGNLFAPMAEGDDVSGGWRERLRRRGAAKATGVAAVLGRSP